MDVKKKNIDISFYRHLWRIVFPIIIQNLLSAAVSSADVIMLNYVGQSALSASALAVQYVNVISMVIYGMGTGATMLCAQYWGKGDPRAVEKVQGIALRITIIVGILVTLCSVTIPRYMMLLFTPEEEIIDLGIIYLRIVSFGLIFWCISEVYIAVVRSIGRVSEATIISITAPVLNVFFNAVFIFGLFGMPKLGIAGVALGTSLSRFIQFVICLVFSKKSKDVKLNFAKIFESNKLLWRDFLKIAIPAVLNDVSWGLAYSTYSIIMGHLGSDVVAANSVVTVARNFGTVVGFALASATGIILGQMLGRNDFEKAKAGAHRLVILSAVTGLIGGLIILLVSPLIVSGASLTPQAKDLLKFMLMLQSYYCMGQTVNTSIIVGVFRAGGDTRFGFICDTIDMWVYAVPLGFIAAFVLKLPVKWVYFLLLTDEFVKWPVVFKRYFSYKWVKNITRDNI
ncbi:MATE family efflux transporter [Butyrivibrio fibrisolvens]|uniref:MATE family efflux transporter n=1 Tax=Butyrivibrio fibrisolvens TaxID=831 RepID=UPI00040947DC|nr:MATE family efflux transporter [Butyrivibrio fibrisolvens]